jgi:hypothetical protein
MDTIITKYHGATNTKGARISASVMGRRVYVPYPYDLDGWRCHAVAARALLRAVGLPEDTKLIVGEMDRGYAFIRSNWSITTGTI